MGEQRTLPLVARYTDACNLFDIPDGGVTLRHKLDVLAKAWLIRPPRPRPRRHRDHAYSCLAPGETSGTVHRALRPTRHASALTTSSSSPPAPGEPAETSTPSSRPSSRYGPSPDRTPARKEPPMPVALDHLIEG